MRNILVVAAHPDDEILGCGGTIAKHVSLGDKVHVAILAEGLTSRFDNRDEVETTDLHDLCQTAQQANDILGTSSLTFFDFPDNRMDSVDRLEVTKKIELLIEQYEPSVVYSHHSGDVNIDHRIVHEAVITACRPQPGSLVRTMFFLKLHPVQSGSPLLLISLSCRIGLMISLKLWR